MLTSKDFEQVGSWQKEPSREQLPQILAVLDCLCCYFRSRGEPILHKVFRDELDHFVQLQSYRDA